MIPLSELNLDRKGAEKYTQDNICAECGSNLTVAWGGAFGVPELVIRCGNNQDHSNYVKRKTYKEIVEDDPVLRHAFALNVWGNEPMKEIERNGQ